MTQTPTITITIAREVGAGGAYIGQQLASLLNCTLIDRQILEKCAEMLRVQTEQVAGRCERVSSFWEKMFRTFSTGCPEHIYTPPPLAPVPDEELFRAQQQVIRQLCSQGNTVVIGHAGFYVLRDRPDALHIFVHAPPEDRARRVMQAYNLPSIEEARAIVTRTDAEREAFVRDMARMHWRDPHNFDLCIDSSRIGISPAAELVASLARRRALMRGNP